MSTSNSLKYKLWRRRLSVSAPHMTIHTRAPWPLRLLYTGVVLLAGGMLALWISGLEGDISPLTPAADRALISGYKEQIEKLRTERDQFSTTVNAAESQLNIERSAQKQLVMQVKTLEADNVRLKEDLAFFDSLLPTDTGPAGINIRRLTANMVAPNQLRYQLLAMQGGKGDRQFLGNVQLVVTVMRGGQSVMMTFPEAKPGEADKFKVAFRHYQRVEGVITLPDGVVPKAVQARVLENGQIRAQLSVNL